MMKLIKWLVFLSMSVSFVGCGDKNKSKDPDPVASPFAGNWVSEPATIDGADFPEGTFTLSIGPDSSVIFYYCLTDGNYEGDPDFYQLNGSQITVLNTGEKVNLSLQNSQLLMTDTIDPATVVTLTRVEKLPLTCLTPAAISVVSVTPALVKPNQTQTFTFTLQYRNSQENAKITIAYFEEDEGNGVIRYQVIPDAEVAINSDDQLTELVIAFDFWPVPVADGDSLFSISISTPDGESSRRVWAEAEHIISFEPATPTADGVRPALSATRVIKKTAFGTFETMLK